MIRSRPLFLVLGAVAATAVVVLALLPMSRPGASGSGGLIGREAPSLRTDGELPLVLEGPPIDLDRLRGQVVWLNFWTTSCVPCRTEMPAMQRLAARYAGDGLVIVGINVGDGPDSVRAFVDELGVRFPIVLDVDSAIFSRYSPLFGVPRHYFVGRDGRVVAARIGELQPAEMEPLLQELMGEASGRAPDADGASVGTTGCEPRAARSACRTVGPDALMRPSDFRQPAETRRGTTAPAATPGRPPPAWRPG